MTSINYPRGTIEKIHVPVTASITLGDAVPVAIAIGRTGTETYTWLTAAWAGTAGTTRTAVTAAAVTLSTALYPNRSYTVYAKVTDSPEVPIIEAGTLFIT